MLLVKCDRVQECQAKSDSVQQDGQVARFEIALPDRIITKQSRVAPELFALEVFLCAGLHHFDAGDGFFKPVIDHTELTALMLGDRNERACVTNHDDEKGYHNKDSHQTKFRFHGSSEQ